jgi:solute:Na+ symporter, SSS family
MHFDHFLIIDLVVIFVYFTAVIYVGLKFGEKEDNLEDFSLGARSIPWWAVLASIIAAETSAATFIGAPGEGYELVNYTYLQIAIGTILGRIIVAFTFIKPYFDLNVFSIYEFLELRFGRGTRVAASATFLVTRVLASGARLYVAAIVLAVGFALLTGSQPTAAQQLIVYLGSIIFITVITAIYTSVGGIKAVVWTDFIQASVMLGGAISAIFMLVFSMPGGVGSVLDFIKHTPLPLFSSGLTSGASFGANVKNVLSSEYTIWVALLGSTFTTLATHGTDQDMVQRMLTATDYKKSRLSLICSGLADLPIAFIFITIGILLHLFYQQVPDPTLPHKNTEIFAHFILKQMPVGIRGLLVAGIFATAMGSLSAALNALATSCTRDFYQSGRKEMTGQEAVGAARKFTCIFAGLMIVVASITAYFVIEHPESRIIPIVLGIFGYTYGSLLGVFLLGMLTKTRGNDRGNFIAMIVGFIVVALMSGLPNQVIELCGLPPIKALEAIPSISFLWRIMFGSLATLFVASLFRRKELPAAASAGAEGEQAPA